MNELIIFVCGRQLYENALIITILQHISSGMK